MGDSSTTAIKRYAVLFNPSLERKDLVAAEHRAMVRQLQPLLLDRHGFDAVYRLDAECQTRDVRQDIICMPPTVASLEKVVEELKQKHGVDQNATVFTTVLGHGSREGLSNPLGRDIPVSAFAKIWNQLPRETSRVTIMHQCHAGAFAALGMADENDLFWAYATGGEVNVTGPANYAVLFGEDQNQDSVVSFQEMLWASQRQIYKSFAPFYRRFVFQQGPRFIDRGLGLKPAASPFPDRLIRVPDIATYLEKAKEGAKRGMTVIGFEARIKRYTRRGGTFNSIPAQEESLRLQKKLDAAARKYGGRVQFLWLPQEVANDAIPSGPHVGAMVNGGKSFFTIFYIGSDPDRIYGADEDVSAVLEAIHNGQIGEKKR